MKISIALCTYNGESFLQQQVESIEGQIRKPDELVACDDCSQDRSLEILSDFAKRADFHVKIIRNEHNLGSTRNFEKAIKLCTGDIIALCDQDDVWKPHKLACLEKALQANPEAGYAFSDADLVDEHLQPLGRRLWDSIGFQGELKKLFTRGEQFRCFTRKSIVTGATMAFRAPIGRMAMPFPIGGHWIHDGWIALLSSAIGNLGVPIDEPLISYRQHPNQQLGVPASRKRQSLLGMYRELKTDHQSLFVAWEKHCLRILSLKDILHRLQEELNSPVLEQNLIFMREFETHFLNRRKILTSSKTGRLPLILLEAFSGRYARFANSWRTVIRDLLL